MLIDADARVDIRNAQKIAAVRPGAVDE